MRTLLLLRGSCGCGKSTWIEEHNLKPYTLCADDIRLLCQSPVINTYGYHEISQANDKEVWNILFRLLEKRMQNGEFTVIDATNSKTSEMNRYKDMCQTYRYRMFCVDFTDIPIEVVKSRNANRTLSYKVVPDEAIDKMYSRFATQKIPSGITVVKPDELDKIFMKKFDFSEYKKIHVIGDIHGCYTALQEYLGDGIHDDEFYIFCGDYTDRGIENADVIKFLLEIYTRKNVLLLEGNHEIHLNRYAHDVQSKSKEFELITKKQLDEAGIDKKQIRQLYRKFGQCAYFTYDDKTFFICHGGVSRLCGDNITFMPTIQLVKGVGNYNDFEVIADTWAKLMPDNYIQIHGHRNTKNVDIKVNDNVYNLEGRIEFGGDLRCIQITHDGITTHCVKNEVFRLPEEFEKTTELIRSDVASTVLALRNNKHIQEKQFGNISSFNFTKNAFYDKIWNEQTITARGLYINTERYKVAARGYEKFFNINERPETNFDMLQYKLQFPITAYVKENGFLGIVSYNEETDDFFITTKSSPDGEFAEWLRDMFYKKTTEFARKDMLEYLKNNPVSLVFECVDMTNDPHIIEYSEDKLFLLDIIYNDIEFKKYDYEDMCNLADKFGLEHKEKAFEIADWQEFFDWYYEVTDEDYEYNGRNIEGFVIEDAAGFMTKLKLHYYNFWKFMRSVSHEAIRNGYIRKTSALTTALANEYYGWVKTLHDYENKDELPRDIVTLRNLFYKEKMK